MKPCSTILQCLKNGNLMFVKCGNQNLYTVLWIHSFQFHWSFLAKQKQEAISVTVKLVVIWLTICFQESAKPRIPPMIISTSKIQTPLKEKEKKKGSLVRTIKLPGASQLQSSAHNYSPSLHSHGHHSHSSSHHTSSHHSSTPRSHHKSSSSQSSSSHQKKSKKKKRKRYASDSDDDNDSDYDPCGWNLVLKA